MVAPFQQQKHGGLCDSAIHISNLDYVQDVDKYSLTKAE